METPPLVLRARELAAERGFEKSSLPEDGALLHVLAARRGINRAAEIGTGVGVGAAWIASALPPGVRFFTAEIDPELAACAAELFADDPDVTVLVGTWQETLPAERRDAWLEHPLLTTVELWVTRERRALLAVRR